MFGGRNNRPGLRLVLIMKGPWRELEIGAAGISAEAWVVGCALDA
jgi:hypothetical protein